MTAPPERPAIRPLDVQRIDEPDDAGSDRRGIVLTDRLGLSEPTFVPEALLPIVGRCTGEYTVSEILAAAAPQFEEPPPREFVEQLVRDLDDRGLLVGPRFDTLVAERADEFLAQGTRPATHAGSAGYPASADALRTALRALVPGPAAKARPLRGLIAPHIDLGRGRAGYQAAYERLLAAPPADLYVIFGTGHAGPSAPVTGLPLDWQTPLGTAPTDREFLARIHDALGAPDPGDLLIHRDEHSIEFQVLFLQHVHALRDLPPPRVAGFLCGSLPSVSGDPLAEEYGEQIVAAFHAAAEAHTGTVCWIAGADLAHIGPFFGDQTAIDDDRLTTLATAEHDRLAHLQAGRPGAFHAAVEATGNPDRVCSAPAIALTAALATGPGELLHYGQARAEDDSQTVSFCAMAFA
ncbi:MAG: AmmeMemoRadiSam system protein B [bacterium]|nr:AmmeMemoRadiSam system protein B [bacterium]